MTLETGLRAAAWVRLAPLFREEPPLHLHLLRPTHLHEREGDGERNILWGWPNKVEVSYDLDL